MAVSITLSDLSAKVNEGWKKPALAVHYGLPVAQVTRLLKDAGLTIRKFHAPKFTLVNDLVLRGSNEVFNDVNDASLDILEVDFEETPVMESPSMSEVAPAITELGAEATTW